MSFAITIVLKILGALFGPVISRIRWFKKESPVAKGYKKADEAEAKQAESEEQLANMKREKELEDDMKKPDDEYWQGGKF